MPEIGLCGRLSLLRDFALKTLTSSRKGTKQTTTRFKVGAFQIWVFLGVPSDSVANSCSH